MPAQETEDHRWLYHSLNNQQNKKKNKQYCCLKDVRRVFSLDTFEYCF